LEGIPFFLQPVTIDLVKEHEELIAAIRATLTESPPVVVVLDTLNRSLVGSESSDTDMSNYVRAADAIRDAFSCSVIIVHHCGINDTRPRGHTSLTGAADAQLAVKRDINGNIGVTVEFLKDGEAGETIASKLESVEVGTDDG
jgi:RecA-family ATPase